MFRPPRPSFFLLILAVCLFGLCLLSKIAPCSPSNCPTAELGQGWRAAELGRGWHNFEAGYGPAAYRLTSAGEVALRGVVQHDMQLLDNNEITRLPEGYRPPHKMSFAIDAGGSFGRVEIAPDGAVTLEAGVFSRVSLDGIRFYPLSAKPESDKRFTRHLLTRHIGEKDNEIWTTNFRI